MKGRAITPEQKLALFEHATTFSWDCTPDNAYDRDKGKRSIEVVQMRQKDGSFLWCIRKDHWHSFSYTKKKEWEYEDLPSSRTKAYLKRSRWTLKEALAVIPTLVAEYKDRLHADMVRHLEQREVV
jgi:hypothetical protein